MRLRHRPRSGETSDVALPPPPVTDIAPKGDTVAGRAREDDVPDRSLSSPIFADNLQLVIVSAPAGSERDLGLRSQVSFNLSARGSFDSTMMGRIAGSCMVVG